MRRAVLTSLLGAMALTGCALAPPYVQPAAPIPAAYPASSDVGSSRAATDVAWREFFGDPQLLALIERALANNRDLAVSVARIDEARARYRVQRAQSLPQVNAAGSGVRVRQSADASGAGSAVTFNSYDVDLGVSAFELDLWGRVRNLTQVARQSYRASLEDERAFRLALIRDVAQTYLNRGESRERVALAERTLASRREGLEIARLRLDAGVTSSVDYDQSVVLVTQAETDLAAQRLTEAQTDNLLAVLVGGPAPEPLPPPRGLADQRLFEGMAVGLPSDLLLNRPDIRAAEAQLRAANANIGAARAAYLPTLSLTGAAGFASTNLDSLFGGDQKTWSFGGAFNLPIFDGGARAARVGISQAQRDIAVATYQRTVQEAFREVADALQARRLLTEQILTQQDAVDAQRRLAETARLRYDNGIAIYLEVLDAERNLFSAEQTLIQLRGASLRNEVALYAALGGGMESPADGASR